MIDTTLTRCGFPATLDLVPVSRHPTTLSLQTVRAVLGRPIPTETVGDRWARYREERRERVSIVIATFNNLVFNRLCLESLLANTDYPNYEVIVVDNGSTDGTKSYLRKLARHHRQLRPTFIPRNLGFARANNLGIRMAEGDVLVLLNNDTIVPNGWLSQLLRHLDEPEIGLLGPVTNRSGNEAQIETSYGAFGEFEQFAREHSARHDGECFDIPTAVMFCAAMRRAVWERVGPLDERFEVGMFEDDDYSMRVREAGYRVVCAEDAFVHHFGQASIGKLAANGQYGARFHANRRLFEEKWDVEWHTPRLRTNPEYDALIKRIREVSSRALPSGARVVVISKGDDELLELGGRTAWHFPRQRDGVYAGHYPKDSDEAISHLESLREKGAEYFLMPEFAFWWLEQYDAFRQHLEDRHRLLVQEPGTCLIYELTRTPPGGRVDAVPSGAGKEA